MKKYVHGLIAGHGGLNPETGEYTTAPKKMVEFDDGKVIYEGVENRNIKNTILTLSSVYPELEFVDIVPEWEDISLKERVRRINEDLRPKYKAEGKELIIWELHLNAFKPNQASGREIYTTRGDNFSDKMATVWWEFAELLAPEQRTRPDFDDGDPDKEANFYVIKNSNSYGCLIEFFFFDNRKEVEKYCNQQGYAMWALTVINAARKVQEKYQ